MVMRITPKQIAYAKKVAIDRIYSTIHLNELMPGKYPLMTPDVMAKNMDISWEEHFRRTDITPSNIEALNQAYNEAYEDEHTFYYSRAMTPLTKEEDSEEKMLKGFLSSLGVSLEEITNY